MAVFRDDVYMHIIKGITDRITKLGKYQAMKISTRREQNNTKSIFIKVKYSHGKRREVQQVKYFFEFFYYYFHYHYETFYTCWSHSLPEMSHDF